MKGEHKRQFAYEAHTACYKHGFMLATMVTPGNVHDSTVFDEVYDRVTTNFPEAETIATDSTYMTLISAKRYFRMDGGSPHPTSDRRQ
ncbi:MAG: transposase [Clostridiales bacterium]|nr:transposase [Clostridiales bacterium]